LPPLQVCIQVNVSGEASKSAALRRKQALVLAQANSCLAESALARLHGDSRTRSGRMPAAMSDSVRSPDLLQVPRQ
jgi:hypothetical protein